MAEEKQVLELVEEGRLGTARIVRDTTTSKVAYLYPFVQTSLTVDVVLLAREADDSTSVLLIERGFDPFKDHWAICGGFVDLVDGETPETAARRELLEETGVAYEGDLRQICAAAGPQRDPRERHGAQHGLLQQGRPDLQPQLHHR